MRKAKTNTIYVLKLTDDCWYVGKTMDLKKRLKQHVSGDGSAWTKQHKPIEISLPTVKKEVGLFDEDNKVKTLMMTYGIDKVRGGSYSQIELPDYQVKALLVEFRHVNGWCLKCGKPDHFVADCPSK